MEKQPTVIMVPTDFSPVADSALQHAIKLAKKSGEAICLFHVIDKETKSDLKKLNADVSTLDTKLTALAEHVTKNHQIPCSYKLKEGNIFTTIGETASEINASIMVMGTHGVIGIQRIVGAYALKVVSSSKIPVMVVQHKKPADHGFLKIVSPIDASVETKQKTMQTVSIAKTLNAKVYLYRQKGMDEHFDDHIKLNLNFVKKYLSEHNVDFEIVEQESYTKNFSKEFIAYSKSIGADLIIILTTNEKGLKEMIIGPEEQSVINNEEEIPVMCVNPLQKLYSTERLSSIANLSF